MTFQGFQIPSRHTANRLKATARGQNGPTTGRREIHPHAVFLICWDFLCLPAVWFSTHNRCIYCRQKTRSAENHRRTPRVQCPATCYPPNGITLRSAGVPYISLQVPCTVPVKPRWKYHVLACGMAAAASLPMGTVVLTIWGKVGSPRIERTWQAEGMRAQVKSFLEGGL